MHFIGGLLVNCPYNLGTGIRINRKRCVEIIEEIETVCNAELDTDKIVKITD